MAPVFNPQFYYKLEAWAVSHGYALVWTLMAAWFLVDVHEWFVANTVVNAAILRAIVIQDSILAGKPIPDGTIHTHE